MKLFSKVTELTECENEGVHTGVIASLKAQGKVLNIGDQFLYLEVRTVSGVPRLVNCLVTVREGE